MWNLITDYWHWGAAAMALRTLLRLIWSAIIAVPLNKIKDEKMEEMAELDAMKDQKIAFLEQRVTDLLAQVGLTGSSSASRASTPTSTTTPTSSPAETPSPDSTS